MNEERPDPGAGAADEIGSVGEEAVKLFSALAGWAKDQGIEGVPADAAHGLAETLQSVNAHVATGGEDCTYCPVCQVIHAVRSTSPEVTQHLASAARSLLHAGAALLATQAPGTPGPGVQKIDLGADGAPWDEPEDGGGSAAPEPPK